MKLRGEPFSTARDLVDFINKYSIKREDILTVLNINSQIFLLYYGG